MAQYGEVRVDYLTYTTGVSPSEGSATTTISGLVNSPTFSGDVNVEGNLVVNNSLTVSGDIIASGVTISGITGLFASGIETAPSIAFVDDTDTGFYNSATNEIRIVTNGNDRLTIDDTGNVGIGTTSPANSIHIKSSVPALRLEDTNWSGSHLITDNANGDLLFTANASNTLGVDSNIRFQIANAERARIDSSGNVGIGTTSPEALLHIVPGNVGTTAIGGRDINYGANLQTSSGRSGFLVRVNNNFTNDSDNSGFMWLYPFDTGGNNNYKVFRSATGSTLVDKFWVNQGGGGYFASNVGIGTTNPGALLHLNKSSGDTTALVQSGSVTGRFLTNATGTYVGTTTDHKFTIQTNSTAKVTVLNTGNVGIGTTNPSNLLDVYGGKIGVQTHTNLAGSNVSIFNVKTGSTGGALFTIRAEDTSDDNSNWEIKTNANEELKFTVGASESMRINSEGRLLVGASSSRAQAGLTGQIQLEGISNNTSTLQIIKNSNSDTNGSFITLGKTRGTAVGGTTIVQQNDKLGEIRFAGSDGTNLNQAAYITTQVDGTPGTNDMPGRIVLGTTATGASTPTERMRIGNDGSVDFTSALSNSATVTAIDNTTTFQSGNTLARAFVSQINSASNGGTPYTITNMYHFYTFDGTHNADATITNKYGYYAHPSLVESATNTYGFYADIAAGSGRWNFYAGGTASNYFAGNVGIGTTSPDALLELEKNGETELRLTHTNTVSNYCKISAAGSNSEQLTIETDPTGNGSGYINFRNKNSDAMRIDSGGRLLVGTSSAFTGTSGYNNGTLQVSNSTSGQGGAAGLVAFAWDTGSGPNDAPIVQLNKSASATSGTHTIVGDDNTLGSIVFSGSDGTNFEEAARIEAEVDGTPGTDDMPGRLVLSTTASGASSPTERMIIKSTGDILFNTPNATSTLGGANTNNFRWNKTTTTGAARYGAFLESNASLSVLHVNQTFDDTNTRGAIRFYRSGTQVGSVEVSTTATVYNTSSDYRLKENVVPLTGASDRLNQLQVHRFNFIADPDTTVDGFLAHEAQAVVPECVTGTKDEVDDDGNPVYQGIDQSKMVPLAVAAIQECIKRIEALETELALLKNGN